MQLCNHTLVTTDASSKQAFLRHKPSRRLSRPPVVEAILPGLAPIALRIAPKIRAVCVRATPRQHQVGTLTALLPLKSTQSDRRSNTSRNLPARSLTLVLSNAKYAATDALVTVCRIAGLRDFWSDSPCSVRSWLFNGHFPRVESGRSRDKPKHVPRWANQRVIPQRLPEGKRNHQGRRNPSHFGQPQHLREAAYDGASLSRLTLSPFPKTHSGE